MRETRQPRSSSCAARSPSPPRHATRATLLASPCCSTAMATRRRRRSARWWRPILISIPARLNLGTTLMQRGDLDGAVEVLRDLIARDPANAEAHYNFGVALKQSDDFKGAEAALRRAVDLGPTLADAPFTLGVVLWQTGRPAEAVDMFRAGHRAATRIRRGALHARHGLAPDWAIRTRAVRNSARRSGCSRRRPRPT